MFKGWGGQMMMVAFLPLAWPGRRALLPPVRRGPFWGWHRPCRGHPAVVLCAATCGCCLGQDHLKLELPAARIRTALTPRSVQ